MVLETAVVSTGCEWQWFDPRKRADTIDFSDRELVRLKSLQSTMPCLAEPEDACNRTINCLDVQVGIVVNVERQQVLCACNLYPV